MNDLNENVQKIVGILKGKNEEILRNQVYIKTLEETVVELKRDYSIFKLKKVKEKERQKFKENEMKEAAYLRHQYEKLKKTYRLNRNEYAYFREKHKNYTSNSNVSKGSLDRLTGGNAVENSGKKVQMINEPNKRGIKITRNKPSKNLSFIRNRENNNLYNISSDSNTINPVVKTNLSNKLIKGKFTVNKRPDKKLSINSSVNKKARKIRYSFSSVNKVNNINSDNNIVEERNSNKAINNNKILYNIERIPVKLPAFARVPDAIENKFLIKPSLKVSPIISSQSSDKNTKSPYSVHKLLIENGGQTLTNGTNQKEANLTDNKKARIKGTFNGLEVLNEREEKQKINELKNMLEKLLVDMDE